MDKFNNDYYNRFFFDANENYLIKYSNLFGISVSELKKLIMEAYNDYIKNTKKDVLYIEYGFLKNIKDDQYIYDNYIRDRIRLYKLKNILK